MVIFQPVWERKQKKREGRGQLLLFLWYLRCGWMRGSGETSPREVYIYFLSHSKLWGVGIWTWVQPLLDMHADDFSQICSVLNMQILESQLESENTKLPKRRFQSSMKCIYVALSCKRGLFLQNIHLYIMWHWFCVHKHAPVVQHTILY